jgi:hypothetical protein
MSHKDVHKDSEVVKETTVRLQQLAKEAEKELSGPKKERDATFFKRTYFEQAENYIL